MSGDSPFLLLKFHSNIKVSRIIMIKKGAAMSGI
jgi:hypothetical protein